MLLAHCLEQSLSHSKILLGRGDRLSDLRCLGLESYELRVVDLHVLLLHSDQVTEQVRGVALAGIAVLYRWDVLNDLVLVGVLVLLERVDLVKHVSIVDLLELGLISLHLLSEVLDPLGHVLRDVEVVLNSLHRSAGLGLLQGIRRQSLVSLHKLLDLLSLHVDFGHFAMVVRQLLVIVVVSRLFLLFD